MSKFLLILLVALIVIWLWRAKRPAAQVKPPAAKPLEMTRCMLCSVHIPIVDATQGKKGSYCCADHLHRAEP